MARKGSQPALYELIRSNPAVRGGPSVPVHGDRTVEPKPAPPAPPARIVRVPIGYAYAAAPVLLVAIVAAYLYGVSVGDRMARERLGQQRVDEMNAASQLPAVDPLLAGKVPPSATQGAGGTPGGAREAGRQGSSEEVLGGGDLGPASGDDPREEGLNYFVLAYTALRNGQGMVDFCRQNGLDAHLVPDDNGELRLVIVLPGFAAGERQSAAVRALESKIRSVGLKWKNAARGNRDFGDAYPKKHLIKRSG